MHLAEGWSRNVFQEVRFLVSDDLKLPKFNSVKNKISIVKERVKKKKGEIANAVMEAAPDQGLLHLHVSMQRLRMMGFAMPAAQTTLRYRMSVRMECSDGSITKIKQSWGCISTILLVDLCSNVDLYLSKYF